MATPPAAQPCAWCAKPAVDRYQSPYAGLFVACGRTCAVLHINHHRDLGGEA